jgi:hypothetical protein
MVTAGFASTPPSAMRRVSALWRANITSLYFILSAVAAVYANQSGTSFVSLDTTDGFSAQVVYIWNYFGGGNSILDLDALLLIHAVRAGIAYFFTIVEETLGIGFATFFLLMLMLPGLKVFAELPRGYLVLALPVVGMVFSGRAILSMFSVAYLVIVVIKGRGFWLLFFSLVFSTLSSGVALNNLIISLTLARNHMKKSLSLFVYSIALSITLFISATDKYTGFSEQRAGYDATTYSTSQLGSIISRSTIFVSFQEGDYLRSFAYVGLAAVALTLLISAIVMPRYRGYAAILISAIPSVFLEGLGFVSLLVPVLLMLAGKWLPLNPAPPKPANA